MNTKRADKPWGYELIWTEADRYVGKIMHIENGFCLSLQYHNVKDETVMVQSGILTLDLGHDDSRKVLKLNPDESRRIPAGTIHRMLAFNGAVDVIEVSTSELDDVVRLEDYCGLV